MKTKLLFIALYGAVAFGNTPTNNPEHWFAGADFNRDDEVTLEEFIDNQMEWANSRGKTATTERITHYFHRFDKNSDGVIVLDELLPERVSTKTDRLSKQTLVNPSPFGGYRDFMSADGKCSTNAKILAYDQRRDMVTIEKRDGGMQCKVKVDLLSEADRLYIQDWNLAKDFNSKTQFKISAKRKKFKSDKQKDINQYYGTEAKSRTISHMGYEITLENCTGSPLEQVNIEYCIYYEQERAQREKQITDEGVLRGSLTVAHLGSRSKKTVTTEPVILFKRELNADWDYYSGAENKQKGEIIGIWIQVHLPLTEGQRIIRHYSLPDSLKDNRRWFSHSVPAGMNRR